MQMFQNEGFFCLDWGSFNYKLYGAYSEDNWSAVDVESLTCSSFADRFGFDEANPVECNDDFEAATNYLNNAQ